MGTAISLVIPAYNETERLPPFLNRVRSYLDATFADDYEVIVVDDGGQPGSAEAYQAAGADWPQFRLICHTVNRGKGAAVCTGMEAAVGELQLFADADGATPIEEEVRLRKAIVYGGADIAVGSRRIASDEVARERAWFRGIGGRVFAWLAGRSLGLSLADTQCGFKMFRREVAELLFPKLHEKGYLFDLELLYYATRQNLRIAEVAVNWSEQPGSHLSLRQQVRLTLVDIWRLRKRLRAE